MKIAITYLIKDNKILMLYKHTRGYYVGPGGKQEPSENIFQTAQREYEEETGLMIDPQLFAISTVVNSHVPLQEQRHILMYSFFATEYSGRMLECSDEGTLSWQSVSELDQLLMYQGDKYLIQKLLCQLREQQAIRCMKGHFEYDVGYKTLVDYEIKGGH